MRQQVDLAILHQQINHHWFAPQIAASVSALARIYLHDLEWEQSGEFVDAASDRLGVKLRSDVLYQAAVRLRRYDALLVPVSRETLAWTRRLLASIPRGPNIPLIGVLHEIQAGGMIDLLELGMLDFVQTPVHPQELRARILCAISRAPMRVSLRDTIRDSLEASSRQRARMLMESERWSGGSSDGISGGSAGGFVSGSLRARASDATPTHHRGTGGLKKVSEGSFHNFGEAKAQLIAQFERQYVRDALAKQHGNVARAAASSGKNRRAFWEIMRKHQIDAAEFRGERDHDDASHTRHIQG